MINSIKLEFYKIRKQHILKILLLVVVIISAISANGISDGGKVSLATTFQDQFMLFVSAIFAGFYIGSDFSNKTIQLQLSQGHSRFEILMAKALVFFAGASIIVLLYPITISVIQTLKFGWGEPFTFASVFYILRVTVLGAVLNIGTMSFFVLFAFLCRDIAKTICICCAFPILIIAISSTLGNMIPIIGKAIDFSTMAQLKYIVGDTISLMSTLSALLSAGITIVIAIALSNWVFSKAEIK